MMRKLIEGIREEWQGLDRRIAAFDDEFAARPKTDEAARRLATRPPRPLVVEPLGFTGTVEPKKGAIARQQPWWRSQGIARHPSQQLPCTSLYFPDLRWSQPELQDALAAFFHYILTGAWPPSGCRSGSVWNLKVA
jgi:hypothetical protein